MTEKLIGKDEAVVWKLREEFHIEIDDENGEEIEVTEIYFDREASPDPCELEFIKMLKEAVKEENNSMNSQKPKKEKLVIEISKWLRWLKGRR